MNRFSIFLVRFYYLVFRSNTASCRFEPTCSQYLIDAAQKYGIFMGLAKTTQRILSCHPLSKRPFYDPA